MSAEVSSPPRRYFAREPVKAFFPHSEDSALSTRGQNLPSLLQHSLSTSQVSFRPGSLRAGNKSRRGSRGSDDVDLEAGQRGRGDHVHGWPTGWIDGSYDGHVAAAHERKMSEAASVLMTPQMRSQRLIGNSNPRYQWEQYFKTERELKQMKRPIRKYYERVNGLIQQYLYIDRLLDSSLPHDLIQEYSQPWNTVNIPPAIAEEPRSISPSPNINGTYGSIDPSIDHTTGECVGSVTPPTPPNKVKRTPKNLYRLPESETTPLLKRHADGDEEGEVMPQWTPEEETDNQDRIVTIAIYVNLAANTMLLALKIIVTVLTSSVSVIASLVDAGLDFLSTAIIWTTSRMIAVQDRYTYPVGRRRLEPIGVLVFSVIMITSFVQVALEGLRRLLGSNHTIVQLTIPALAIMAATVVVKFACWLWCRLVKNSSVQALAQDAMTDVVFNIFSIIFPLVGYYARIWWLDPLGGIFLSFYVIFYWSRTTATHVRNLTGAAALADERNILLYLTMRFAKTIKHIQNLQAYHAGDKLNVEVDIVVPEDTSLRDSHDLGESLQYVLESVPTVDRAFVHLDYETYNLPSHMSQHE